MVPFITILLIVLNVHEYQKDNRLSASTIAILDSKYTEETRTKYFIPISKSYKVKYGFSVNNIAFFGRGSIDEEPRSRTVTVYYDPTNPAENQLQASTSWFLIVFTVVLSVISAAIVWRWLKKLRAAFA